MPDRKERTRLAALVFGGVLSVAIVPLYYPILSPEGVVFTGIIVLVSYISLSE